MHWKILNCFMNHEKQLLNYLMVIFQLYLRVQTMSAHIASSHEAKISDHSNLKISSPKRMLQRLTTALAQVNAGNTSENLLNEIRQIIYSLY